MKFSLFALLPAVALALPTSGETSAATVTVRQTANTITDQLLFQSTLPQFTAKRNARDPATLDWASDGCSSSPDNPFGFPFVPACHRHDFGYRNYKVQARFTQDNRLKIDNNFKKDLYYQCSGVSLSGVCRALADVYYAAVRAFGGEGASKKRDGESHEELVAIYEEKLAIYNQLVKDAQDRGELWVS